MVDPKIFLLSDAVVTLLLAVIFFSMRLMDRRIKGTLWGGVSFIALAVLFTTTELRAKSLDIGIEAVAWMLSFIFGAAMLVGVARKYEKNIPKHFIFALFGLQIGIVTYGAYMNMSHDYWEILGRVPAVILLIGSLLILIQAKANRFIDFAMGLNIILLIALFVYRGVWFADIFSAPLAIDDPSFVTHAILLVVATLITVGLTALTFIISAILGNLSRVRQQSAIDGLSRLLVHSEFKDQAAVLFSEAKNQGLPATIIMADFDHFKHVNDTYGHQAGDEVIAAFGALLNDARADQDIAGRIGGEEFAIVSVGRHSESAQKFAERLRSALQAMNFNFFPANECVTASFGVAERQYDETLESIMARVDRALYEAKQTGRNKVCIADVNQTDNRTRITEKETKGHLRLVG